MDKEIYEVGMFGGSFDPLHQGHVNCIAEASCMCQILYIILSYSNTRDFFPYQKRKEWLEELNISNVQIILIEDIFIDKETYDWQAGANAIKRAINQKINVVFCGSDYKGKKIFETLYSESKIYYFDRALYNISSTTIRENIFGSWKWLPSNVRTSFIKKIVILGTESCGKSSLVKLLSLAYNTSYVNEVGRDISDEIGGYEFFKIRHFKDILIRHKKREAEQIMYANQYLFIDTEAVTTLFYLDLLFPDCSSEKQEVIDLAENIIKNNNYDLFIFLEPDVPWISDGTRAFGERSIRKKNNNELKKILKKYSITYQVVSGSYHKRFLKCKNIINEFFK